MYSSVELIFDLYCLKVCTKYISSFTPKETYASNLLRFAGIEKMEDDTHIGI